MTTLPILMLLVLAGIKTVVYGVLLWIAYINALLAAFNLIPGFPLDGGRVLRSIIWHFQHNLRRATRAAATVGSIFGLLLIALGIVSLLFEHALAGIWWILIGWFVRSAARQEYQSVLYREMLHGQSVRKVMTANPITVAPNVSLADFVDNYIYRYHFQTFPVVDQGRLLGCVGVSDVQRVPRNQWATRPVNDITASCGDAAAIGPDEDAMHALTKMNNTRSSRLLVVEGDKLVGVVTLKDLMHFLGIRMRLEGAGGPGSGVEDQEDLPSDGDDRAA